MDDTLLFLHVLSAFAVVATVGLFWAIFLTGGTGGPLARLTTLAFGMWGAASLLVLLFGLWLAFTVGGYHVWDGWIIAAIVLWAIAGAFGGQVTTGFRRLADGGTGPSAMLLVLTSLAVLLLLADMIWKPGA